MNTKTKNDEKMYDFSLEGLIQVIRDNTKLTDIFIVLSMLLWFSTLNRNILISMNEKPLDAVILSFAALVFPFGVILSIRYFVTPLINKNNNKISRFTQWFALFLVSMIICFLTTVLVLGFHNIIIFNLGFIEAFVKEKQLNFPNIESIEILFMLIGSGAS